MSVLIKGFKVPESCGDCRFCAGLADTERGTCAGCLIDDECREASSKNGCPLVEVPAPHGDLIDIDSKITVAIKDGLKVTTVRKLLNYTAVRLPKTVIEAEDGE